MKRGLIAFLGVLVLGTGIATTSATAATQVIVTPSDQQGWSTADTRPGGTVTFVSDPSAPGDPHRGALQLTTDLTITAKAQYLHEANTPLASVTELSYSTKQVAATFPEGAPSYQVISYLQGGTSGFTTLVFEPYQNPAQGPVLNGVWQSWDVDQGLFWSTRTVTCSNGTILGTPGGPATYTLAQIRAACPTAVVAGFGVNIGSNNPGYVVRADLVDFNGTTYNFEPDPVCREKDDNRDKDKEKSNNRDKDKLPVCKDEDDSDDD